MAPHTPPTLGSAPAKPWRSSTIGDTPQGGPVQAFYVRKGTERRPPIARGEGIYLWDVTGRRYLDASSGPVVSNLGHGNRRVLEAMRAQAEQVTFAYPGLFESEANVALADLVCKLSGPGLDRPFFVSGGSEATEAAIKLARQYTLAIGQPGRVTVIGREPGYHGATLGALAVTGDHHADEVFGPLMRTMPKVPAPLSYRLAPGHSVESYARTCARALEDEIVRQGPNTVLAFIMEPVGGLASGAAVAPAAYYEEVRAVCDRHGVLLIYDEVISGAGRTGTFLAADHWPAVRPDLVTLAKGIAAGYTPFGAVLAPDRIVDAVVQSGGFLHGHTYIANPLSCAIAHAVVGEMIDRDLIGNAARMGLVLRERLEALAARSRIIGDVRGKGLLMAIELVADKQSKRMLPSELVAPARLCALALDHGLALYSRRTSKGKFGDWVMITPPLIIDAVQVDELVGLLGCAVGVFEGELSAAGVI
jgi:adenosylmethionine-8-amino-7-oxononanoate aminotransferase